MIEALKRLGRGVGRLVVGLVRLPFALTAGILGFAINKTGILAGALVGLALATSPFIAAPLTTIIAAAFATHVGVSLFTSATTAFRNKKIRDAKAIAPAQPEPHGLEEEDGEQQALLHEEQQDQSQTADAQPKIDYASMEQTVSPLVYGFQWLESVAGYNNGDLFGWWTKDEHKPAEQNHIARPNGPGSY